MKDLDLDLYHILYTYTTPTLEDLITTVTLFTVPDPTLEDLVTLVGVYQI